MNHGRRNTIEWNRRGDCATANASRSGLAAGIVFLIVGPAVGQLSPEEGLASLHVAPGFRVELAASEPAIVDPIAMCFDADGVMYVCEMRGFQLGPGGVGAGGLGTVRRLEDRDNDGRFETHTLFARDMTFPTTIMAYAGGVLVGIHHWSRPGR